MSVCILRGLLWIVKILKEIPIFVIVLIAAVREKAFAVSACCIIEKIMNCLPVILRMNRKKPITEV